MADDAPIHRETPDRSRPACAGSAGLVFRVAERVEQLLDAWHLVYRAFLEASLIPPNRHRLHAVSQAAGPRAAVIVGTIGPLTVATLTAIVDGGGDPAAGPAGSEGLPLDRLYRPELDALRADGRTLMELALFADRRRKIARCAESLFQLTRHAFHFGMASGISDWVLAVHPRHAQFYVRCFGFEVQGHPRCYCAVNNRPALLLRGDLRAGLERRPLHPALAYFLAQPVPASAFAGRVGLQGACIAGTPLEELLGEQQLAQSPGHPG